MAFDWLREDPCRPFTSSRDEEVGKKSCVLTVAPPLFERHHQMFIGFKSLNIRLSHGRRFKKEIIITQLTAIS
jgi:hypothetical protein